jgi:hypothetical protein
MRASSNLFTATGTKQPTRASGVIWQLNERVMILVLAESHAGVVFAMRADTDRFWAGWSTKRPIFW